MLLWYKSFSSQVQELRILGTKALVFHRLPIRKRSFAYTQIETYEYLMNNYFGVSEIIPTFAGVFCNQRINEAYIIYCTDRYYFYKLWRT